MIFLTAFLLMNAFDRMLVPTSSAASIPSASAGRRSSSSRVEETELTPIGKFLSRLAIPPFRSFRRLQRGFYTGYPDYDRRSPPLSTPTTTIRPSEPPVSTDRSRISKFMPIIEPSAPNDDYPEDEEVDNDSTEGLEVDESVLRPVRYRLHHKKYRVLHDELDHADTIEERRGSRDDYLRTQDVINYMNKRRIEYLFEPMEKSAEYRELRRQIPDHMFHKLNRHLKPAPIPI